MGQKKRKTAAKPAKGAAKKQKAAPKRTAKPAKGAKKSRQARAGKAAPERKASPIPKGFTTVSAHLTVQDAARAIDFYTAAFGAKLKGRMDMPDGRVAHAELQLGDTRMMLADDFPEWSGGVSRAPSKLPATPVTLHVYVKNVDKAFAQAVAAGCEVVMPLTDAFWGDRYGKLKDPFGHEWALATHTRDMTPKQLRKAMQEALSAPPPAGAEPSWGADADRAPAETGQATG